MTFSRFIAAAFAVALLFVGFASQAQASCNGASASPSAVRCIVNQERAARGLARVHNDGRLARAARGHSNAMIRGRFFDHVGADGTPAGRAKAAGFTPGHRTWSVGEILFAGTGSRGTARAAVNGWLNSPPHRAILLSPRFKRAGFGITHGTPTLGGNGNTFTGLFGVR